MLTVATYGRGFWELEISRPENHQPTIEITSPTGSASLMYGDQLDFSATASDPDGDEITIDWYYSLDYTAIASDQGLGNVSSEHSTTVQKAGLFTLIARVTDSGGLQAIDSVRILSRDAADSCSTPHVIPPEGPFPYSIETSNKFGGTQSSDPTLPCVDLETSHQDSGRAGSVWFEFSPAVTATYTFSTCGSQADTLLSAWTGDTCGPYTAIEGACNDDDEQEHCLGPRTDSYLELELEAGRTYRFMAGSWKAPQGREYKGSLNFHVDCLGCTEDLGPATIIPAAAHSPGAEDTFWLTDLQILNPGTDPVDISVSFLPPETDNTGTTSIDLRVGGGSALNLLDVVANLLQAEGAGALRIEHTEPLLFASRTFNDKPDGTFGQYIPGIGPDDGIEPGQTVRFIGLAGNEDYRTNIGCTNASAEAASFTVELFDSTGTLLWTGEETLEPLGWIQLNRVFETAGAGSQTGATARVSNTSENAGIVAYASIVDGGTGDPTYVSSTLPGTIDDPLFIEAAAHAEGVGDSVWRTDLNLANFGAAEINATITLLVRDADNSSPETRTVAVPAGSTVLVEDLLATLFETDGAAALKITPDQGEIYATSRTYNLADNGTFGQFIPGYPASTAVTPEDTATLLFMRKNESFRSNVGIVNPSADRITVRGDFYDGDGKWMVTRSYDLEPYSYIQDSRALLEDTAVEGGFGILSTEEGDFFAYVSMVDNGSDDPVFIPAARTP